MATRSPAKAPAPSTKPTAPPAPAASRPLPAAALAPSTKQAGGAAVKLGGETPAGDDLAPGVMDLKTMGGTFKPPAPIAAFLDGRQRSRVSTRFGKLADGAIEVETRAKGKYQVRNQRLALSHPLFARIGEAAPGLAPCLEVNVAGEKIEGRVGLAAGAKLDAFDAQIAKAPELLGLVGISLGTLSGVVNSIAGGKLKVGLSGVPITLGQAFSGKVTLIAEDETITFDASATINVKGLASGNLEMKRTADGLITGKAAVGLQLPKNLSGSVDVAWDGRAVSGEGKVGYKGEKLSGEVTLRLMERAQAQQLEEQKKAPPEQAPPAPSPAAAKAAKKIDYVVFGEGDLAFAFNAWLNGTAHVIVDPKGYVTIIGKITPQQEFELFPQKDYVKPLFKVEIRASYGIPVVGNIFIFANVGMDAFAKLGPAKFYKIIVQGTYSTDPAKARDFSIQGTLNISAAAGARLRGEAGAGLEVLGHDIKAGAGVNGIAGIKGYAEATPTIGYREKAAPGEDRKGEWFIRGDLEIVGQPFLGLSGDLFVEIDAPWWSPVPDKKWTWPLGGKEWPLGSSLGVGASVDYVFGSGQWPKLDLKPVEFSADKFMTDLYADKAKSGKGGDIEQPGKWNDKNSKAADPPPKSSPKGNATAGKAPALSPAKSRVQPGGTGKGGKHVDPNARTATGKSVKQYQDEAVKKGSKPAGGEVKAGSGKETAGAKDKGKQSKEEDLKNGLAALDAVVARYTKDGVSEEEIEAGVKLVRNKFKRVFKYIKVVNGGETWDCEYAYNPNPPPKKVKKKRKSKGKSGADKASAIDILWVKPNIVDYKRLLLARTVDAANRRKAEVGKSSKDRLSRAELDGLPAKEKMTRGPLESTLLEGITVGVTDKHASKFAIGYAFPARAMQTKNDRKDKVNTILEMHGYNRTDNLYGAPTDGDHVWEKQLGGEDHESNVWPLKATVNQDSGRTIKAERKRILEQYGLGSLDGVWLRLSRNVGGGGKGGGGP